MKIQLVLKRPFSRLNNMLAPRAFSIFLFTALLCTLAAKFFHAWRMSLLHEYFSWIFADIAVLLGIEIALTGICFCRPRKPVIQTAVTVAFIVCIWSVINAGWLIRTGTQILPSIFLPLFRDPLNAIGIVIANLLEMPVVALTIILLGVPAIIFFLYVFVKSPPPNHNKKFFFSKISVSVIIVIIAVAAGSTSGRNKPSLAVYAMMRNNSLLTAAASFARLNFDSPTDGATRKIPAFDQIEIASLPGKQQPNYNLLIVVLEGIQYKYTSLADGKNNLTPYLKTIASNGVEFTNTRSTLTHTTKVLFSLLTGRFPSASQDIAETVPLEKPYASITTILRQKLNFRTAFFQSAKGNFESRPGLIYNLGFDNFWARDNLNDPNSHLGYLASDEFAMLKPIVEWIKAGQSPFFLTILCSATHDPYEVPLWFAHPAKDPLGRYQQAITYTDKFIAALDTEIANLKLADKTIFCVIGDHGEAFGEHGSFGHERIAFEEALRVPFCLRAPILVQPGIKVTKPVSSIDLTPTLLTLLGFNTRTAGFDGTNALGDIPDDRRVYFSGWLEQSPAGFIKGNAKFIYNPTGKTVSVYDLHTDPVETNQAEPPEKQKIADEIMNWQKGTVFQLNQHQFGKRPLFDNAWVCRWTNRISSTKYNTKPKI